MLAGRGSKEVICSVHIQDVASVSKRKVHYPVGLPSLGSLHMSEYARLESHKWREKAHDGIEHVRIAGYGHKTHHTARTVIHSA